MSSRSRHRHRQRCSSMTRSSSSTVPCDVSGPRPSSPSAWTTLAALEIQHGVARVGSRHVGQRQPPSLPSQSFQDQGSIEESVKQATSPAAWWTWKVSPAPLPCPSIDIPIVCYDMNNLKHVIHTLESGSATLMFSMGWMERMMLRNWVRHQNKDIFLTECRRTRLGPSRQGNGKGKCRWKSITRRVAANSTESTP